MSWRIALTMRLGDLALDVDIAGGARPVALVGPNGAGKTTLLRTVAGAHRPASGQVKLGERLLFDSAAGVDLPPEARRVGYVPQGYGLFPHLSALDNVAFGFASGARRVDRATRRRLARELLASLGCGHLCGRQPRELSGGEQQRIALARALMIDPDILLLDEPLSALDAPARRRLRGALADHLARRAGPAIVVTHDLRDVLALEADVHVIEGGRIVQKGTPDALAAEPATDFVAEFFAVLGR